MGNVYSSDVVQLEEEVAQIYIINIFWREMTERKEPQVSFCVWRYNWSAGNIGPQTKIPNTLRNKPVFYGCPKAFSGLHCSAQVWERFLVGWIVRFCMSHMTLRKYRHQVTELNAFSATLACATKPFTRPKTPRSGRRCRNSVTV